jgi:hypothetical protein
MSARSCADKARASRRTPAALAVMCGL